MTSVHSWTCVDLRLSHRMVWCEQPQGNEWMASLSLCAVYHQEQMRPLLFLCTIQPHRWQRTGCCCCCRCFGFTSRFDSNSCSSNSAIIIITTISPPYYLHYSYFGITQITHYHHLLLLILESQQPVVDPESPKVKARMRRIIAKHKQYARYNLSPRTYLDYHYHHHNRTDILIKTLMVLLHVNVVWLVRLELLEFYYEL